MRALRNLCTYGRLRQHHPDWPYVVGEVLAVLLILGSLLFLSGCQSVADPLPPVAPPAEDISSWSVPALVQPEAPRPRAAHLPSRAVTAAEKVSAYVPGEVYKVPVGLDAPLDIILEAGEQVRNLIGSDPRPLLSAAPPPAPLGEDAQETPQAPPVPAPSQQARWEVKEAVHGSGEHATPHIFLRALEPGARLGLTITTSKRVYYLTCKSVGTSPIRAVWWTYASRTPPPETDTSETPLLPVPDVPRLYHAGYQIVTSSPPPTWTPRGAWDDGKKFYILYPEIVLFGTVPLVRLLGPNGPQVVNSFQVLNVVVLDLADVPRVELRVGTGEQAEVVTITRGPLRTIACPQDAACPQWPVAAPFVAGR